MRDPRPIYSFPDIKEPEKTTSWEDRKGPKVELVDHELEKAKRRTELLKAKMSPPGALGLPPLLEEHRLKYGIPDGAFKVQALFDRIFVFPIDAFDGDEAEKTTGGLFKPNTTKLKDKQEGHRGVIISAGLTAMDRLMSHGVELGDIVITNKNVPYANRCEQLSEFDVFTLIMREADLAGDETLQARIRAGKQLIVDMAGADGGYSHQIADVGADGVFDDFRKKKSVYINDTW
jgi:co-chaperonin GroES (HSP10)